MLISDLNDMEIKVRPFLVHHLLCNCLFDMFCSAFQCIVLQYFFLNTPSSYRVATDLENMENLGI